MPLAAPGVFTAAILVFIFAWNDFIFANTLTSTDNARTVPATLAFFTGGSQFEQPIGAISAASIVVTVPIVILVFIFQRRIVAVNTTAEPRSRPGGELVLATHPGEGLPPHAAVIVRN